LVLVKGFSQEIVDTLTGAHFNADVLKVYKRVSEADRDLLIETKTSDGLPFWSVRRLRKIPARDRVASLVIRFFHKKARERQTWTTAEVGVCACIFRG
jgi:hypothetical protein